ncbi:MAG: amidohydrolase family protein [Chitinophagaceae bacterium]|nr:amidohydrolase family protein [Chitinophagaceae bacterium]
MVTGRCTTTKHRGAYPGFSKGSLTSAAYQYSTIGGKINSLTDCMSYRKFKADHLFTGTELPGNNKVLVIKSNGEIEGIINENEAGEDIESFKGTLTPGFVNAHCHLELSHMKDLIPEKTGLVDFVYKVVNERHFAEEEILNAIENAENEMLSNGIVAVGDICNNLLTLPQKQKQRLAYYNFIEASGWLPTISQTRFERTLNIYNEFLTHNPQLTTRNSIVPHAPYSVSDELWKLITPYFKNKAVSIHNQETVFEDELFLQGSGDFVRMYQLMNIDNTHHQPTNKSSLQSYFSKLSKAASLILVHNTFIKQEDIDFAENNKSDGQQLSFCICINANQYIENAVPPIQLLMKNNCNIVLGTDSLAGNWSLNLLDEMKTIQKNFPGITLKEMLQWSTINGAKALQMDTALGSFEKGKKPGVVLIENTDGVKLKKESSVKRVL